MGKIHCTKCSKKCSGEVLKVQDKYFHIDCFKCKVCKQSLSQTGFFLKNDEYYCAVDYQQNFGVKCCRCAEFVEGEVVTAMGNTYHRKCLTCARCRKQFPSGAKVTFIDKEVFCQKCLQIPLTGDRISTGTPPPSSQPECAGCGAQLKEGQALMALDRQWHVKCFKCTTCHSSLDGEYMGKDGLPYCERDYQQQFGVRCSYCDRYISGKVLQAGDSNHFHPTCARCTKCGEPFGDGEEMFLQGMAIWHPRCGPRPGMDGLYNGHISVDMVDGLSSVASDAQNVRAYSPALLLREYPAAADVTRLYTCSYLTSDVGYLRGPIHPYDKPPKSPHFHRPPQARSRSVTPSRANKQGMQRLVESIVSESPRPRSPHMNNEEPIGLAHFPDAHPPDPNLPPKIERDDFPAPPFPYTDPERRRRWSGSSKKSAADDSEDEIDASRSESAEKSSTSFESKLKKEEVELSKMAKGIGRVFLQDIQEREKLRQWRLHNLDPRNASRTPSADKELHMRLRYMSPINASPSRYCDHPRPWEEDEDFDRSSSYRSSIGRSVGTIPSYHVVSSVRHVPKPGYGFSRLRSPFGPMATSASSLHGDYTLCDQTRHSRGDLSSTKSEISCGSATEHDGQLMRPSSTFTSGLRFGMPGLQVRRSLPNVSPAVAPKIYPLHLLHTSNYRLPADVNRLHLECHLSDEDFENIFHMSRSQFYRLPTWKCNELKRRVRLY